MVASLKMGDEVIFVMYTSEASTLNPPVLRDPVPGLLAAPANAPLSKSWLAVVSRSDLE